MIGHRAGHEDAGVDVVGDQPVHDRGRVADATAIVTAILALARSLRLGVTAEGVETEADLDMLRHLGVRHAQERFGKRQERDAFGRVEPIFLEELVDPSGRLRVAQVGQHAERATLDPAA